jgi:transcriptional regulator with XRE-family HTH domain
MQLKEQEGLAVAQIAERMNLTIPRVERLLEEEAQFRDLQQYICDAIPVEVIQALVRQRQEDDPELTQDALARECGYKSRVALLRVLGLAPSAKVLRRGKEYPPQLRTEIDVETASRIARALGFVPREIPGL